MRKIAMGFALAAMCFAAHSQQMYRCGKVFQDRPCDAGVQEQRLTPGGGRAAGPSVNAPAPATATSPYAAQCSRVGEQAQSITWKREGGATMEKQISEAHGDRGLINLITSVYARRGTAPDIRAQIEKECVVERERQANAAAALADLQRQANPAPMGSTGVPAVSPSAQPANATAASQQASIQPDNTARCSALKSRRSDVEARLRKGGTTIYMEQLQNDRRDIESQMQQARC